MTHNSKSLLLYVTKCTVKDRSFHPVLFPLPFPLYRETQELVNQALPASLGLLDPPDHAVYR